MLAKATRWASVIEPIAAEDPYLDLAAWRSEKERFFATLKRAVRDFETFLRKGYTKQELAPSLPEPTPSELDALMAESGLALNRVNNCEFTGGAASDSPAGTFWYGASGASETPGWNTLTPLSGVADLRFEFAFSRVPGAWNEWIDLAVPTDGTEVVDIFHHIEGGPNSHRPCSDWQPSV